MTEKKGFWRKQRRLPPWLRGPRTLQLCTVLLLLVVIAFVKGGWIIWLAFLFILAIAVAVALVLRYRQPFL
jgi:hypothetical protein